MYANNEHINYQKNDEKKKILSNTRMPRDSSLWKRYYIDV
jgi:hypothetical protein